jgi:ribosomal protein L11 methyltransferase
MHQITLVCAQDQVEPISDALDALDALSVSVEDADAHTDAEQALFAEPGMDIATQAWNTSHVIALFDSEEKAQAALQILSVQDFFVGTQMGKLEKVQEQDWVRITQAQFAPVAVTERFWIVPTWHAVPEQASKVIRLDPGMAFGTGTHPTTKMCLGWIASHPPQAQRVLDYGCGSGILAIGAALFGANAVDAVDIDPDAVVASLDNARSNQVHDLVRAGLPDVAAGHYDLVIANILASPLKVLAPLLCQHIRPGGQLLLAGILSRQEDELKAAYAPWVQLHVLDEEEGWILMGASHAQ